MITMFGKQYNEVIIRRITSKEHPSYTDDTVLSEWDITPKGITVDYDESGKFIVIKGPEFKVPHRTKSDISMDQIWIPLAVIHSIMVPLPIIET
jgi:hypothetical protein